MQQSNDLHQEFQFYISCLFSASSATEETWNTAAKRLIIILSQPRSHLIPFLNYIEELASILLQRLTSTIPTMKCFKLCPYAIQILQLSKKFAISNIIQNNIDEFLAYPSTYFSHSENIVKDEQLEYLLKAANIMDIFIDNKIKNPSQTKTNINVDKRKILSNKAISSSIILENTKEIDILKNLQKKTYSVCLLDMDGNFCNNYF